MNPPGMPQKDLWMFWSTTVSFNSDSWWHATVKLNWRWIGKERVMSFHFLCLCCCMFLLLYWGRKGERKGTCVMESNPFRYGGNRIPNGLLSIKYYRWRNGRRIEPIALVIRIRSQLPPITIESASLGPGHAARFNKSGLIIKWNGNG